MGLIYLIQPPILIGTDRYKVGCSKKNKMDRLVSYGIDTNIHCVMEVLDPLLVEAKIKKKFKDKFKLITGNEWFEGDINEMKKKFVDIVSKFILTQSVEQTDCSSFEGSTRCTILQGPPPPPSDDHVQNILEEYFEQEEGARTSNKEIEKCISQTGMGNLSLKEVCKILRKSGFKYDKNTTKFGNRGVFFGIKLKIKNNT